MSAQQIVVDAQSVVVNVVSAGIPITPPMPRDGSATLHSSPMGLLPPSLVPTPAPEEYEALGHCSRSTGHQCFNAQRRALSTLPRSPQLLCHNQLGAATLIAEWRAGVRAIAPRLRRPSCRTPTTEQVVLTTPVACRLLFLLPRSLRCFMPIRPWGGLRGRPAGPGWPDLARKTSQGRCLAPCSRVGHGVGPSKGLWLG